MKRSRISSLSSDTAALTIDESLGNNSSSASKYAALDTTAPAPPVISCTLPPHAPLDFGDTTSYETHYLSDHTHRCVECHSNFPSAHFLDLHITESHDPICAARRDAGEKIYVCFVEGCEKVTSDWKKRRSHLIDKHGFPKNYDFFIVRDGTQGRRSLLRAGVDERGHRRSSRERGNSSPGVDEEDVDDQMNEVTNRQDTISRSMRSKVQQVQHITDEVTGSLPTQRMIPRSVTFGRRHGNAGFAKS